MEEHGDTCSGQLPEEEALLGALSVGTRIEQSRGGWKLPSSKSGSSISTPSIHITEGAGNHVFISTPCLSRIALTQTISSNLFVYMEQCCVPVDRNRS